MEFKTRHLLGPSGRLADKPLVAIDTPALLHSYQAMVLTRYIDERMITLQRQGVITFAMSSKGEEACAVAAAAALQPVDWIYPQYREAGTMFYRGATPLQYVHQMFGDAEDLALGRQMPNHFGDRRLNIVTVSSPIGTNIPHAADCAGAMKLQQEKAVALCFFGEGATSEGDFHVALRFAAVRKDPVIFFCRNNGYAISTPCTRQFATDGIAPLGHGHGILTSRVDGNDFFAIYEAVALARKEALEGKGPTLIEAMTYRMGAHSTSDDPTRYRNEEELKQWEAKCPIMRLRLYLEQQGLWDETEEKQLQEQVREQTTQAINTAKETAPPSLASLIEDVYAEVPPLLKEQIRAQERL